MPKGGEWNALMFFDEAFTQRLRDALLVSELVSRRVRLVRRGREFTGLCPFHNEKTPSFTVNDDKQFFHCFGCGAHGDVFGWVMQTEGLSYPEAVERLAELAGIPLPRPSAQSQAAARERADLHEVLERACQWFQQRLLSEEGAAARAYLEDRGVTQETIQRFRLGFAPDRRGVLQRALAQGGVSDDQLVAAGLVKRADSGDLRDYFFGRIIFPITDRQGRVIAFGGRSMDPSARAKYLNSPETSLFDKGRTLYNLHQARRAAHDGAELLVVEGYMDVIALAQAGFSAAVAPLGTALTEEQIVELWRLTPEPLLCLDGDSAGQRAASRAAQRALPLLKPGCSLRFVTLPSGTDPDTLIQQGGVALLRSLIESARLLEAVVWEELLATHRLDSPERQAALRQAVLATAAKIEDKGVQAAYRSALLDRYFNLLRQRRSRRGGAERGERGRGASRQLGGSPIPRPAVGGLRRLPAQILLAFSITYPYLAVAHLEGLALQALKDRELEALRRALVDLLAEDPDLDSRSLECHLRDQGFSDVLDRLLGPATNIHEPMLRADAIPDEIDRRFAYWLERVAALGDPGEQGVAL
ncbi:MAG TPA: DNA primase [Kiloniellales bacterium]|nr:DNA primase [Kiloniellales bacterium]